MKNTKKDIRTMVYYTFIFFNILNTIKIVKISILKID